MRDATFTLWAMHALGFDWEADDFMQFVSDLERDEDGRVTEAFAPDFYLPDQDLYIEVTTMKQSLVTKKNRKMRLLRELYPDLRIKILYRRDIEALADRHNLARPA
jgi:GH15 family glucan-1,4-alpha-glucosidase